MYTHVCVCVFLMGPLSVSWDMEDLWESTLFGMFFCTPTFMLLLRLAFAAIIPSKHQLVVNW